MQVQVDGQAGGATPLIINLLTRPVLTEGISIKVAGVGAGTLPGLL